jgi:hypothetical protein
MDIANYGKHLLQTVLTSPKSTNNPENYENILNNKFIEDSKAEIHHYIIAAFFRKSDITKTYKHTYKELFDYVLERHSKREFPVIKFLTSTIVKQYINYTPHQFDSYIEEHYDYSESCTSEDS